MRVTSVRRLAGERARHQIKTPADLEMLITITTKVGGPDPGAGGGGFGVNKIEPDT